MAGAAHGIPEQQMPPGCSMGRRQTDRESVILWTMFSWEILRPGILVDVALTCNTYLIIVACQEHPFIPFMVFTNDCVLFHENNAAGHTTVFIQV